MNVFNDFPMLNMNMIYFDNAATTYKPKCVIDKINDYYCKYTASIHRGDYDTSYLVSSMYENVREKVKEFINANSTNEIVFTSGSTQSLNMIVNGFFDKYLNAYDEVLITKAEHASNILPWLELSKKKNIKVKYIDLDSNLSLNFESLKKSITSRTKAISIAHITNVIGDERPVKEIIEHAHKLGILVLIDGAQSVPHIRVDVKELDIDFLVFSAHKMCGPTGVGVLYAKENLMNEIKPDNYGGGMSSTFNSNNFIKYKDGPTRLEGGTPNISGVLGFGSAIDYLNKIGMDNIDKYVKELRKYAITKLSELKNIEIYNKDIVSSTIIFNVKDMSSIDTAAYLNKNNICIRAGNHCAKMLKEDLGINNTCRISLYFYNTKEDIDKLYDVLEEID